MTKTVVLLLALGLHSTSSQGAGPVSCVASDAPAFTIAMLPDTQMYHYWNHSGFPAQVAWIAEQYARRSEPFAFVTHVGDVVECGRGLERNEMHGFLCADCDDNSNRFEWANSSHAMGQLDWVGLPYSVSLGNHDRDIPTGAGNNLGTKRFNRFFGEARFAGRSWNVASFCRDAERSICNSRAQRFEADGRTFLHINLEFAPDEDVLRWATSVLESHPDWPTIVSTHEGLTFSCQSATGTRWGCDCGVSDAIPTLRHIRQFVEAAPTNLFLVLSGHVSCSNSADVLNEASLLVPRQGKPPVWALMSDYSHRANGGDGMLRLIRFFREGEAEYHVVATPCSPVNDKASPGRNYEQRLSVVPLSQ
jgi:hypothetical protein